MQTLVHHTGMFNSYVAIDPSMWWDHHVLLDDTQKALSDKQFAGRSLFLGYANNLEDGMNIATLRKDKSDKTQHMARSWI